jgi:hypothetical protein
MVGGGPSYLLFTPTKEVLHLASGLTRALRLDLQGYDAIGKCGKLDPLVWALTLASSDAIYDVVPGPNAAKSEWAAYVVMREIEGLIREFPHRTSFDCRLRRLCTALRAAGILGMYHTPPEAPGAGSRPSPPGSFFTRDRRQQLLILGNPPFAFRVEPDSPIAQAAQELWRKEQAQWGKYRTVLYRVPTRTELGEHLCLDKPATTKVCRAEGFAWLPRASAGRPPMSTRVPALRRARVEVIGTQ